jgi:hypothetical protein
MKKILLFIFLLSIIHCYSQPNVQFGFDGKEYMELLAMFSRSSDTIPANLPTPAPVNYERVYHSKEVGLKNSWDLWLKKDKQVAVISIRGTVAATESWLENFYAAMIPAIGSIQINDSTTFNYKLASDSNATVHVGWTIGLAHLAPTIVQQIKLQYANGVRLFIIAGHSQGGAICFLTTSYLYYLQQQHQLPADISFKSYCSAAPKPGNLYYAYDFDFITRNGKAFTIVNAKDWVPETPFSVQRISDYNAVNPFVNVKDVLGKQKLLVRWYLNSVYNKMNRRTRKAQQTFEKYLGDKLYSMIKKYLPQLKEPQYVAGNNFMRAGVPIILMPDEEYKAKHPDDPSQVFTHHMPAVYYELAKKYYSN